MEHIGGGEDHGAFGAELSALGFGRAAVVGAGDQFQPLDTAGKLGEAAELVLREGFGRVDGEGGRHRVAL